MTVFLVLSTLKSIMPQNGIAEEIRSKAVAAAEAVYRLSEAANFDPALKFELRKISANVLSRLAGLALGFGVRRREEIQELLSDVAAIQELIRFAAARSYIAPQNSERMLGVYSRISDGLAEIGAAEISENPEAASEPHAQAEPLKKLRPEDLNDRQRRILEYVASNPQVQMSDIRRIFGEECSEKTLQRDLWQLVNSGLILRQGDYRWTSYSIGHSDVR